jgi:spermidine/putrescine-binding protein
MKQIAVAIVAACSAVAISGSHAKSAEKINYVTAGGVYLDNIKKAFLEPIGKKLGIEWGIETSDSDTQVRIQVKSNTVTYDIVEFGAAQCARGAAEGLYEKLDFSVIDKKDLAPGSYSDYWLCHGNLNRLAEARQDGSGSCRRCHVSNAPLLRMRSVLRDVRWRCVLKVLWTAA